MPGFELGGDQGLLGSASGGSLSGVGGYSQEGAQYASYGQEAGGASGEQQGGYAYQQTAYSSGSTVEGQQYGGRLSVA